MEGFAIGRKCRRRQLSLFSVLAVAVIEFMIILHLSFTTNKTQPIAIPIFPTITIPEPETETYEPTQSNNTHMKSISSVKSRVKISEASYQNYVRKRMLLVSDPSETVPWSLKGNIIYFWDYFLPTFNCPHGIDRVGTLGDGGKYVCGLELFSKETDKPCVVYSFGVSNESSFEAELLEKTNCNIYAYDGSVPNMGPQISSGPNPRIRFTKTYVGAGTSWWQWWKTETLGSLMRANGHNWIDILKVDIEGAEVGLLNQVMDEFEVLPFGQLQVEIHTDKEGEIFPQVYKLWERMEMKGLRAFKNELNLYLVLADNNPGLMEYAFINIRGDHRLIR